MTQPLVEMPSGLRTAVERLRRVNKLQAEQIERLTRMLLLERLKDGDIDFAEGLHLLDHYRPDWIGTESFDQQVTLPAVEAWLSARRGRGIE